MTLLTLLALAAAWWLWKHYRPRPRTGAGASARARARELRTPLVRLADLLNIETHAGRLARNSEAGAVGEERAAARLAPLAQQGWTLRYDLALPPGEGNANVDGLAISPSGGVFLLDPKMMPGRHPVTVSAGRLWHGEHDVTSRVRSTRHEAAAVSRALGVPVTAIAAIEGAPLRGPHGRPATELSVCGVRIVPAEALPDVLRKAAHIPGQRRAAALTATADRVLLPYTRR